MQKPPPDWGQDRLTDFVDAIYKNCWATFANLSYEFSWLKDVDFSFSLVETTPKDSPIIESFLFTRSQAAFRSSATLAMAGLAAESFCLNRSCVESALYGLHIHCKEKAAEIWINRHNSKTSEQKCRVEFAHGNVMRTLKDKLPELENIAQELYQRSVDFGAHPNERAVTSGLSLQECGQDMEFILQYMSGDEGTLKHAIKSSAQSGTFALLVNGLIFKHHYQERGIGEQLKHLCSKL